MTYTATAGRIAAPSTTGKGLGYMLAVWRQRQVLKNLDDRMLRDIGLTRAQALAESRRPVWDAPESWRS